MAGIVTCSVHELTFHDVLLSGPFTSTNDGLLLDIPKYITK